MNFNFPQQSRIGRLVSSKFHLSDLNKLFCNSFIYSWLTIYCRKLLLVKEKLLKTMIFWGGWQWRDGGGGVTQTFCFTDQVNDCL